MSQRSSFFQDVYDVVKLIPKGRVTSYGAIGKYLGMTSSARMVGWAMNASNHNREVPAHRVVNRSGVLTGKHFFDRPNRMQELLIAEGIEVIDDQIQHFEAVFWDPSEVLL